MNVPIRTEEANQRNEGSTSVVPPTEGISSFKNTDPLWSFGSKNLDDPINGFTSYLIRLC